MSLAALGPDELRETDAVSDYRAAVACSVEFDEAQERATGSIGPASRPKREAPGR